MYTLKRRYVLLATLFLLMGGGLATLLVQAPTKSVATEGAGSVIYDDATNTLTISGTVEASDIVSQRHTSTLEHVLFSKTQPDGTEGDIYLLNTCNLSKPTGLFDNCSNLIDVKADATVHFVADNSGKASTAYMFCNTNIGGSGKLSNVEATRMFDTSQVTDMRNMFCLEEMGSDSPSALQAIDVSHFDTSRVTSFANMFAGCTGLKSLDLSTFDTSNVTSTAYLLSLCISLEHVNLNGWSTHNVEDFSFMFPQCRSLQELDVSMLDTSNGTDFCSMFGSCSSLKTLDLSRFDTSHAVRMSSMFSSCSNLASLDLSSFSLNECALADLMFNSCINLQSLDISSFDLSKLRNVSNMFRQCTPSQVRISSACVKSGLTYFSAPSGKTYSTYWNGLLQTGVIEPSEDYFSTHPGTSLFIVEDADVAVTFWANGGMFNKGTDTESTYIIQEATFASRTQVSAPDAAALTSGDRTFLGWATYPSATVPDVSAATFPIYGVSRLSYYAVWSSMVATFNPNGGTWQDQTSTNKTTTAHLDELVPLPDSGKLPEKEGYTCIGWASSASATTPDFVGGKTTFTSDINPTYYAIYSANPIISTVSFSLPNGATWDGIESATRAQTATQGSLIADPNAGNAPQIQAEHMVFVGYFQNASTKEGKYVAGVSTFGASALSYTAVFEAQIKATFELNGEGTWQTTGTSLALTTYGASSDCIEAPDSGKTPVANDSDYAFSGWYSDSGAQLLLGTTRYGSEDTTWHAQFSKVDPGPAPDPGPDPDPDPTPGPAPVQKGWEQDNQGWKYYRDGSALNSGWAWVDDIYGAHWYYFYGDGYMAKDQWIWDDTNASWYYVCSSGPMIQGIWQWIGDAWYGFWWDGKMCTGWVWDAGWNAWFYCYQNGVMARNTWVDDCWLNWEGVWVR